VLWNGGAGSTFSILSTNSNLSNLVYSKDTGIVGGAVYEFKIVALNIVGQSNASPSLAVLAAEPPSEPLNLVKFIADKSSISVRWEAPDYDGDSAIQSYNLYWDNATGSLLPTPIGTTSWQTLTFSVAGLTTDRYYTFAVAAVNVVGEGPAKTSAPIITATVPGQPQTPALKSSSKSHIEIMWSDPIDLGGTALESYIIEMD
jgi:hypothetical protein